MPMMKRLYNKNVSLPSPHGPFFIALAQFFASHALSVSYDADPIYATLFQNFITGHCNYFHFLSALTTFPSSQMPTR